MDSCVLTCETEKGLRAATANTTVDPAMAGTMAAAHPMSEADRENGVANSKES